MTIDPAEEIRAQLQGVRHHLQDAAQQLQPYRDITGQECGSEPLAAAVRGLVTRVTGTAAAAEDGATADDNQDGQP